MSRRISFSTTLACLLAANGCIKAEQSTVSEPTAHSEPHRPGPAAETCVPPEISTGDPTSVGTTPCEREHFQNGDLTREPPDIHPY